MKGIVIMERTIKEWICIMCAVGVLLGMTPSVFSANDMRVITKGPYLTNPKPDSMTIMWEYMPLVPPPWECTSAKTSAPVAAKVIDPKTLPSFKDIKHIPSIVRYGVDKNLKEQLTVDKATEMQVLWRKGPVETVYLFRCTLTGLSADTKYYYQVETGGGKSELSYFKTPAKEMSKFKFVVYGSSKYEVPHEEIGKMISKENPDFILHTGNMINDGRNYWEWEERFFRPLARTIDHIPFWSTMGFGDKRGGKTAENIYKHLFALPENMLRYSFDYGIAHFVSLDCLRITQNPEDMKWCEQDLGNSKALWKFVFTNEPLFFASSNGRVCRGNQEYISIFQKHGVDIHLSGQLRFYQRFHPMYLPQADPQSSLMYVIAGNSGYGSDTPSVSSAVAAASKKAHYAVFTVDGRKLSGRVMDAKGGVIDEFSIEKKEDGSYSESYLKTARDTREMTLRSKFNRGSVHILPTETESAEVLISFTFADAELKEKIDLKISLTGGCKAHYRMDPEVVTATIDPSKKSTLKLKLFAKKGAKISRKGKWIIPRPFIKFDYSVSYGTGSVANVVMFSGADGR
jgi:purple acid phosphatase-like protein/calcineurin-like phosphoesterase family protein